MANLSKLKLKRPNSLGSPPPLDEASRNLKASEIAPGIAASPAVTPIRTPATAASVEAVTPQQSRLDGRSLRKSGRLIPLATRVSPEFDQRLRNIAQRDGAVDWGLFGDVAEQGRHLKTFVVESWGEYLRQQERATEADRQIWEHANSFHVPTAPPSISRLLYAYHQETKPLPNTLGPTH